MLKGVGGTGPSQEVWKSMVKVERCRYLEASKCKGTCMNLCKLPTEAFFQEELGASYLRYIFLTTICLPFLSLFLNHSVLLGFTGVEFFYKGGEGINIFFHD